MRAIDGGGAGSRARPGARPVRLLGGPADRVLDPEEVVAVGGAEPRDQAAARAGLGGGREGRARGLHRVRGVRGPPGLSVRHLLFPHHHPMRSLQGGSILVGQFVILSAWCLFFFFPVVGQGFDFCWEYF